jgi:RNA polymerase sigma-70 factor (ECF subfamily)
MGELAGRQSAWNDAPTMAEPPASFEELFHSERDRLFRLLCVITGSRHEAEDIAQEAFARVWERWTTVSVMANPTGYLHRTAINLSRSRYRRAVLAARRTVRATVDEPFEAVDDRQVALQFLRAMAPRQRAAIVLTEVLGYTAEEAAKMLAVRAATVRALHFQARAKLRDLREISDV